MQKTLLLSSECDNDSVHCEGVSCFWSNHGIIIIRLMLLLQELNKGVVPPIKDLKKAIVLAADTLTRDRENGNNKR